MHTIKYSAWSALPFLSNSYLDLNPTPMYDRTPAFIDAQNIVLIMYFQFASKVPLYLSKEALHTELIDIWQTHWL